MRAQSAAAKHAPTRHAVGWADHGPSAKSITYGQWNGAHVLNYLLLNQLGKRQIGGTLAVAVG